MKLFQLKSATLLMLACWCVPLSAQEYQGTSFGSFEPQTPAQYAITPPANPDTESLPGYADSDSMSPDSWSEPNTGVWESSPTIPSESGVITGQVTAPANGTGQSPFTNGVDSTPSNSFQPAGFPNNSNNVFSLPNRSEFGGTRYPLGQQKSGNQDLQSEVLGVKDLHKDAHLRTVDSLPQPIPPQRGFPDSSAPNNSKDKMPPPQTAAPIPQPGSIALPTKSDMQQPGLSLLPTRNFRPDLGHMAETPLVRNFGTTDRGQKYDFEEKKKQYPGLGEILATGRYFGSFGTLVAEPHFQANSAVNVTGGGAGQSQLFEFGDETGPRIELGFESKYGPGIELTYWQVDSESETASFVSNGATVGETTTWMLGPKRWSRLVANNLGDTINAVHTIDVEQFGVSFFKEVKLPISRINGSFGFQYLKIAQSLNASLVSGASTDTLTALTDIEAYGPRLVFEYFRPVGHTKLEFVTTFGASILFGDRNQFVSNTAEGHLSNIQANEFITAFEFFSGVQYTKNFAENRAYFGRVGFDFSTWIGGGTSNDPTGDFGLRGFSVVVGYNR